MQSNSWTKTEFEPKSVVYYQEENNHEIAEHFCPLENWDEAVFYVIFPQKWSDPGPHHFNLEEIYSLQNFNN